jgi:hypothetical protein
MILAGLLILVGVAARVRWARKVRKHPAMVDTPAPPEAASVGATGPVVSTVPTTDAAPVDLSSTDAPA